MAFRHHIVLTLTLVCLAHLSWASPTNSPSRFHPHGIAVDSTYSSQTQAPPPKHFTLTPSSPIATIDYGTSVAGWPTFYISALDGPVQIEVKYSEAFDGLTQPWSDGPFPYNEGLMNTFRVETFNISTNGLYASKLLQGGQRWQSVRLLTAGSVTFESVSMTPSVTTVELESLPGAFSSSSHLLNDIWKLGARSALLACVDKGSQRAVWTVDRATGAHIENLRPHRSVGANGFEHYTLEFETMIERGGLWWSVAQGFEQYAGLHLQLVSELPEASTFVNTNKTLTPPNTVRLAYGFMFVNQTTLPSRVLDTFSTPFPVKEGAWLHVKTVLSPTGHLSVLINGSAVFRVLLSDYGTPIDSIPLSGSFGFGAWQDHAVNIRNVVVTDTQSGNTLYTNKMTDPAVLAEYGAQANLESVCLDGPKRDRLVWLGDFYHTVRIIGTSTGRFDFARKSLSFFLKSQLSNGQLSQSAYLGYDPSLDSVFAPSGHYLLDDYQILGFLSFYQYIRQTSDLEFARGTWTQWEDQLRWLLSRINPIDGLVDLDTAFLGPARGSSAVSCAAVQALNAAAELADRLGKPLQSSAYRATATNLSRAINSALWAPDLGAYSQARSVRNVSSLAGIAFCITSGVSTDETTKTTAMLAALAEQLHRGIGYMDNGSVHNEDDDEDYQPQEVILSPNTNGLLLQALVDTHQWSTAAALITQMWEPMARGHETSTGASWEYITSDGRPGLGVYTSLAHPWGGAPTYILSEWVAGLRAAKGAAGYGYQNWIVNPELGRYMGLEYAGGRVPLYGGGHLSVEWRVMGGEMRVSIEAPKRTSGAFQLGGFRKVLRGRARYTFVVPGVETLSAT